VLAHLGARPRKALGQNFLTDQGVALRIAEAATTPVGGTVLEIGPGLGALTRLLLARAGLVVAIERDRLLAAALRADLGTDPKLQLVEADALEVSWGELLRGQPRPAVIAGNLPYSITGPILRRVRAAAPQIDCAVLMVQREVADRIVAAAGTKAYGAMTVAMQASFTVGRLALVKARSFHPVPKVDSAVVVLTPKPEAERVTGEAFERVVEAGFATRRKMLRNAWRALGLPPVELERIAAQAGVTLDARAETLTVRQFAAVAALAAPQLPVAVPAGARPSRGGSRACP
jgi:16S rRNA (adenine1518-N6/adenine1519-N6)-dimethyltransferase